MALADIYVLDLEQAFENEPIHNIFTYKRSDPTLDAQDLIEQFTDGVLPAINALQTTNIQNRLISAYSLEPDGDIWEVAQLGTGGDPGEMLPIFNAINFTLKPNSRAVRPGSKRFSGIPETAQEKGTITKPGYITGMEGLRVALGLPLTSGIDLYWEQVVVKRVKYTVPDSDPPREAYRFPETELELVSAELRAVLSNTKISHQTSRGN